MKNAILKIFACKLLLVIILNVHSQTQNEKLFESDLRLKENNNLKNFPLQFGIEIGKSVRFYNKDDFTKIGIIGYVDFNIYKKIFFIKLEGGSILLNDKIETQGEYFDRISGYAFIGLNIIFLKYKKNRFMVSGGIAVINKGFLPFLTSSLKYLYIINKYIGLTASVKYPFIRGDNPYVSIGLQFFNH